MSDEPEPANITNRSGGADLNAQGDITIGADVVGRDKITQTTIYAAPEVGAASMHQLPPPPPDFTGRETELTQLLAQFDQGVTIFGLQGQGGIGKTALALKLAEQLIGRYPDAQLFLDLKGVSDSPLPASEIMAYVVRSFQPTAKLPDNGTDLQAAYRSTLYNKKVLLVLDDVRNAGQIKPLLPAPAGCGVIITSRLHFHVQGLCAQALAALPMQETCALLLKIAPRIDGEAEHLARLCGCLPLTLTIAGGALAERIDLSVASYVRRLEDERTRLDMVVAVFTLSYVLLSEELQKTWRTLAVFPATFELDGATAVCDLKREVAEMQLSELVRHSLLEWKESGRYQLHDLARLFANSQLGEDERMAAQRRHAEHYKEVLSAGDALYLKGGQAVTQGLALIDSELENIRAGQEWAAGNAASDNDAAQLCSDFADAGANCLDLRLYPREMINWLEAALSSSRRVNDRHRECDHLDALGLAYEDVGELQRAIKFFEQALSIAYEIGDRRSQGACLGHLGSIYVEMGTVRRAIQLHEQALTIACELGNQKAEGIALSNLGWAYMTLNETRRAIEFYERALALDREIGDRRGEGFDLSGLGRAYVNLGEAQRAIKLFQQALVIDREIGDRRGEGDDLVSLGRAYSDLGMLLLSGQLYEKALAIARETSDWRNEIFLLYSLGFLYVVWDEKPQRGIELIEKALETAREIGVQSRAAACLLCLSGVYVYLDEMERAHERESVAEYVASAIRHLESALTISEEIDSPNADKLRRLVAVWRQDGPTFESINAIFASLFEQKKSALLPESDSSIFEEFPVTNLFVPPKFDDFKFAPPKLDDVYQKPRVSRRPVNIKEMLDELGKDA